MFARRPKVMCYERGTHQTRTESERMSAKGDRPDSQQPNVLSLKVKHNSPTTAKTILFFNFKLEQR